MVWKEEYVFATNDIFGPSPEDCAILRVNGSCGAFIVTSKGNLLPRVKEILERCLSGLRKVGDGISPDLAGAIVESFEAEHGKDASWRQHPLPFLLLLVGHNHDHDSRLYHMFIRNRVIDIHETEGARVYRTSFDTEPPVPAPNLFYGHSELPRYLSRLLPWDDLDFDAVKVVSCLGIATTQTLDASVYPGMRMAALSLNGGFTWVGEETLQKLAAMAHDVDARLAANLFRSFVRIECKAYRRSEDKTDE